MFVKILNRIIIKGDGVRRKCLRSGEKKRKLNPKGKKWEKEFADYRSKTLINIVIDINNKGKIGILSGTYSGEGEKLFKKEAEK